MAKPKISRPILYAAVLGVAAYAVVLLTEPDTPPTKHTTRTTTTSVASTKNAASGILPEDLKAHFDRMPGPSRDAFLPHVVSSRALAGVQKSAAGSLAATGNWVLTGISAIDGVQSALLENTASGTNVFLKVGDVWMAHRVTRISDMGVTLINDKGQQMELTFPSPDDLEKQKRGGPPQAPGQTPPSPGVTVTQGAPNLMPFPVPSLPGGAGQQGQPGNPNPNFPRGAVNR